MSTTRIVLTRAGLRASAALLAALLSLTTTPAASQSLPNSTVSIDRVVIGCQVREAIELGEQVEDRLASATASDDIGATHKLLDTMYKQIRLALMNLNDRRARARVPEPLIDLEVSKITFAWHTIRRPVDKYFDIDSVRKESWLPIAAIEVQKAMVALRQAENLLPQCSLSRRTSSQAAGS